MYDVSLWIRTAKGLLICLLTALPLLFIVVLPSVVAIRGKHFAAHPREAGSVIGGRQLPTYVEVLGLRYYPSAIGVTLVCVGGLLVAAGIMHMSIVTGAKDANPKLSVDGFTHCNGETTAHGAAD